MTYRVLISGSRREQSQDSVRLIATALAMVAAGKAPTELILAHGDASGVDSEAKYIWKIAWELKDEAHPYLSYLGRAGGPVRNSEMVEAGADVCIAFPDKKSVGTWDLVNKAKDAGIPTFVIKDIYDLEPLQNFLKVNK